MRRVTRYTAREVLTPAVSALLVTTFLLLTTQLLRIGEAAFGYGLTVLDFLSILALLLPRFFVFTLPIAVLVGVVGGLGRLSADREVLAMEGAGLSPLALWPGPLLLGVVATVGTLALTTTLEPAALASLQSRLASVIEKNLSQGLVPGVVHEDIPGLVLHAARRDPGGALGDVFLHLEQPTGEATLVARRARLTPAGAAGLVLEVEDGELFQTGRPDAEGRPTLTRVRFEDGTVPLDVSATVNRRVRFIGDLDTLGQRALLARARTAEDPDLARKALVAWHRRLAVPFACLAFALLGMPLGLGGHGGRGERRGFAFIAGLGVVVAYYILVRVAEASALSGTLPVAAAEWIPNGLVAVLGGLLLWRRSRR